MTKMRRAKRRSQELRNWGATGLENLESRQMFAADVVTLSPAPEATEVAVNGQLSVTFSDDIQIGPGAGNIDLVNAETNEVIESVNARSENVTIEGNVVTIKPSANLPANTQVAVRADVASFRDMADTTERTTIFSEDFEQVPLQNSVLVPSLDNYVAVFTGTLDVQVAGEYTFGINSDDRQQLAIDLAQDGIDLIDDEIIFDNNRHGRQDRLSTCAFDSNDSIQSCEGEGDDAISLDVGQYAFQFMYFENGGGSGGEFFYAPGKHEIFSSEDFVLVGDASKGIGVVDGITVTTYKEVEGVAVDTLEAAEGTIEDDSLIMGTEVLDLADIAENPGGRFDVDNEIPGAAQWRLDNDPNPHDFSPNGPTGWVRDNSDLIEGGSEEYNGWMFMNKDFWITEQGGQNRTDFELASGTVLVADPDAHDDFIDNGGQDAAACLTVLEFGPECGLFTASVDTPMIYLDGVAENSAQLSFASSWWDEDTQSAETRVEYFDADGQSIGTEVLLRWESIADSPNYKPQMSDDGVNARNEQIEVSLNNPADATSMVVTFDMPYATNDWWWSVDNIVVTAEVQGAVSASITDNATWAFTTGEGSTQPAPASVGDLDGDNQIGFADFLILSANFGNDVSQQTEGDIDNDGTVGFADFLKLSANYGKSVDEVFAQL